MAVTISGTGGLTFPDNSVQASSGTTTTGALRAWVNFNGTGTVAIRASGNVTSITDNGVADYTVNLTTAMPDVNYTIALSIGGTSGSLPGRLADETTARTTSAFRILAAVNTSFALMDVAQVNVAIFR